jgi:hypothetical protein
LDIDNIIIFAPYDIWISLQESEEIYCLLTNNTVIIVQLVQSKVSSEEGSKQVTGAAKAVHGNELFSVING